MLLYEITGRQFSGLCTATVRPANQRCTCWWWIPAGVALPSSWGWGSFGGYGWGWGNRATNERFGCQPLSRVKLPGYPVREILEVKIDGAVVDPSQYRLDGWRWLTRLASEDADGNLTAQRWPGCSRSDCADDEPGTFSVSYQFGISPPPLGVAAAAALASEIFNACTGGECALPSRVTKVLRQGVQIDRVITAAAALRQGNSGIQLVDAFLAGYPGTGRRPSVFSPDVQAFARRVGS